MARAVTAVKAFTIPPLGATDLGNNVKVMIKDGHMVIDITLGEPLPPTYDKASGLGRKNWSYASTRGNVGLGNGMQLGLNLFGVKPADLGK